MHYLYTFCMDYVSEGKQIKFNIYDWHDKWIFLKPRPSPFHIIMHLHLLAVFCYYYTDCINYLGLTFTYSLEDDNSIL